MISLLLPFFYCQLIIFFLILALKNVKKFRFPGAFAGITIGFLVYYAVVPFLIWVNKGAISSDPDWRLNSIRSFVFSVEDDCLVISILSVILGYLFFLFGYYISPLRDSDRSRKIPSSKLEKNVLPVASFGLIFGAAALFIYIRALGGFAEAISKADTLRQHYSSVSDYGLPGYYDYIFVFARVLPISTLLFLLLFRTKKKPRYVALFLCSLAVTVLYMLIHAAKSTVFSVGCIFLYLLLDKLKIRLKWVFFAIIILVSLPLLDVIDALFAGEDVVSAYASFSYLPSLRLFSYPTELNCNMMKIVDRYGYQYFTHYFTDIFDVLPGVYIEPSYSNTSEFITGVDWKVLGGTPNDLITYGFLQAGVFGVCVSMFLWGILSKFIDKVILRISDDSSRKMIGVIMCMSLFNIVSTSDIAMVLKYNLSFALVVIILCFVNNSPRFDHRICCYECNTKSNT